MLGILRLKFVTLYNINGVVNNSFMKKIDFTILCQLMNVVLFKQCATAKHCLKIKW